MGTEAENTAAIQAGASIFNNTANALFTGASNKKTRKWNEKQYAKQRADSLTDWATQNEYNSPKAQMERFKAAGLNPNLIYGQGNMSEAIKSSDTPSWNPSPPQIDLQAGQIIGQYQQSKLQQTQIDQLRANITVQQQDAMLKAVQAAQIVQNTDTGKFDLSQKMRLADISADTAIANLQALNQQTSASKTSQTIALNEDQRRAALTSQSLREGASRILQIQANTSKIPLEKKQIEAAIKLIETDTRIKKKEAELREQNINPNDPTWQKELWLIIEPILQNIKNKTSGKSSGVKPGLNLISDWMFPK